MSSNTIFSSIESEKRWVLAMEKNFPQEHTVDINFDTPTSIFRIPKTLSETNPEAYTPQHLGLGPYHHIRPELYPMQKPKLAAVKNYLETKNPQSFQKVVEALVQFEPFIRQCYDQQLDVDIQTLAWILTIDGLYLLQLLENPYENKTKELNTGDIMMLENQIPVIILKKIRQALQLCKNEVDYLLFNQFHRFCEAQSPLKLNQQQVVIKVRTQLHLLHRMYHLIVNNRGIRDVPRHNPESRILVPSLEDLGNAAGFLAEKGVPGAAEASHIITLVETFPWDKILTLFKKQGGPEEEQSPSVVEITVPSVSQMVEIAKIKFTLTPGGIKDVRFDDTEEPKNFYLPVVILKSASAEIILRNLLAFEAASAEPGSTLELAEYVDLMCGIIDTPKDVRILKNERIIESELSDEEIARIFNGISKSTNNKSSEKKSKIDEAIEGVNKKYDGIYRVKVARFLKKYVPASFKFLGVLITIAVLVLLILSASCSVFGCGHWFGKK